MQKSPYSILSESITRHHKRDARKWTEFPSIKRIQSFYSPFPPKLNNRKTHHNSVINQKTYQIVWRFSVDFTHIMWTQKWTWCLIGRRSKKQLYFPRKALLARVNEINLLELFSSSYFLLISMILTVENFQWNLPCLSFVTRIFLENMFSLFATQFSSRKSVFDLSLYKWFIAILFEFPRWKINGNPVEIICGKSSEKFIEKTSNKSPQD